MKLISKNPANSTIIFDIEEFTHAQIENKLNLSTLAFQSWKNSSLDLRIKLLDNLKNKLIENKSELGKLVSLEVGQPIKAVYGEIEKCASLADYYKNNLKKMLAIEKIETEATESYIKFEALGTILGIAPWNFPYWMSFRFIIPTLAGGNTVLLKHSSNVSQCSIAIERIISEAGFPEGVFQILLVSGQNISSVITDKRIKGLSFSGSESAGSKVASLAAGLIKPTLLELGGSDAFIVLKDADIELTAKTLVDGRLRNAGQACNSPKRVIIQEEIFEEFKRNVLINLSRIKIGDPLDESVEMGPIATQAGFDDLKRQLDESVRKGARIIIGGNIIESLKPGLFLEPTVVENVKPDMPLFDEEVFGPIIVLIKFKTTAEAIDIANNSVYGLGASIWTSDTSSIGEFISNLEVGNVFVNQPVRSDPRLPYGGSKKSGYGRELSHLGIKEFMNIKTVVVK